MSPQSDDLTPEEARSDHWEMLTFLAANASLGAMLGVIVAFAIFWLDLGGVGTTLSRSSKPVLPPVMLAVLLALTFAAAVTASAVMSIPYRKKKQR